MKLTILRVCEVLTRQNQNVQLRLLYLLAKVGRKIGITKFFVVKVLNQDEIWENLVVSSVYSTFADEKFNGIVEIIPSVTNNVVVITSW